MPSETSKRLNVQTPEWVMARVVCAVFRRLDVWTFGLLLSLSGCNILGPAAYVVGGPPKVDAQHKLADVPTVVFIDDRNNVMERASLRRVIADSASQELMIHKCVETTISGQDAMTIAAQNDRHKDIMPIEEIGKAVGAKQVIYVEMTYFSDTPDGATPRPTAQCRVRVVDVDARKRVFPDAESGETARGIQASTREVDLEELRGTSSRLQVFQALAEETGAAIARLFYKHEPRPLGKGLTPR